MVWREDIVGGTDNWTRHGDYGAEISVYVTGDKVEAGGEDSR
jgi:hypothetical protein